MTWVRIDDGFAQHPKILAAGPVAMAMQVAALCYSSRNLTDGFVPWGAARSLLPLEFLAPADDDGRRACLRLATTCGAVGEDITPERAVRWLVANGLWDEVDGGYRIHDYLDWNPSRAQVEAARAATVAQRSAAGRASARARKDKFGSAQPNGTPNDNTNGTPNEPRTGRSNGHRTSPRTEDRTEIQRAPNPTPTPTPDLEGARAREELIEAAPPTSGVRVLVHRDGEVRELAPDVETVYHEPASDAVPTGYDVEIAWRREWQLAQHAESRPAAHAAARVASWASGAGVTWGDLRPALCELAARGKGLSLLPSMYDELRAAKRSAEADVPRRHQITAAEIEALDTPPEPPPGWTP